MSKNSIYQEILQLVKDKPKSQREIMQLINKNAVRISLQGIAKHIRKALDVRAVVYLGNKVNKKDGRWLLKDKYDKSWAEDAHKMYLYTSLSEDFYKRLNKKYGKDGQNKELIDEITELYRFIEITAYFQEINIMTDQGRKNVADFYKIRDRERDKILRMSPVMYWVAFKDLEGIDYSEENSVPKNITFPMIEKLKNLIN